MERFLREREDQVRVSLRSVDGCGNNGQKMFTKLSASIDQFMGFITIFWNCDNLLKGRCYGNRFVVRVGENWHTSSSFCALAFHNRLNNRNTDCFVNTAVARFVSWKFRELLFGNAWELVTNVHRVGVHRAEIRYDLILNVIR